MSSSQKTNKMMVQGLATPAAGLTILAHTALQELGALQGEQGALEAALRQLASTEADRDSAAEERDALARRLAASEESAAALAALSSAAEAAAEAARGAVGAQQAAAALAESALRESQASSQELRGAWHRSERSLHEATLARAEAERCRRRLTEALVRERAGRIMAQLALRPLDAADGGDGTNGDPGPESGGSGGDGGGRDMEGSGGQQQCALQRARLALAWDELEGEGAALALILDAVKQMRRELGGSQGGSPPSPATPIP